LTIFGAAAVSTMALAYALETRHRAFILLFAIACACSSVYGFLIGSVPFGAVEALWSVIALQRFKRRKPRLEPGSKRITEQHAAAAPPRACGN
jgi:hypothetical protein